MEEWVCILHDMTSTFDKGFKVSLRLCHKFNVYLVIFCGFFIDIEFLYRIYLGTFLLKYRSCMTFSVLTK